jgi:hypothetical protein
MRITDGAFPGNGLAKTMKPVGTGLLFVDGVDKVDRVDRVDRVDKRS